jgi:hypothetical protein
MNIKLLDDKQLKNFSPGPGIESFDDHLYLVGDDARYIQVMNRGWKIQETISLFASDTFRMTKELMSDFNATTFIQLNKLPFILMIGSGSGENGTSKAVLMNLNTRAIEEFDLAIFYSRLKESGFEEVEINALTVLNDKLVLCMGANKTAPDNRIIVTSLDFWKNQHLADIMIIKIELEGKAGKFLSLTGLKYSYKNDWLITTILSEDAVKKIDDGSPGECFIGVVEDASRKIGRKRFKINEYFNLPDLDKKFKGQRLQSLCIQADKENKLKLHLVSANSNGEHFLFKVRLKG